MIRPPKNTGFPVLCRFRALAFFAAMWIGSLAVELFFMGKGPKRIEAFIFDGARMVGYLVLRPGTLFKRRLVRNELKALMQQPINYGEEELKAWAPITTRPPKTLWDAPAMRSRWRVQSERPANDYLFYEGRIDPLPKNLENARGRSRNAAALKEQPARIEFACGLRGKLRVVLLWKECRGFKADEPFHLYYRERNVIKLRTMPTRSRNGFSASTAGAVQRENSEEA